MIILSYNIRGVGSRIKRKRVGFLSQKGEVDVVFIQEMKLCNMELSTVRELCGDNSLEWSYSDANRAWGGILTMWEKILFTLLYRFKGDGYLGLCVDQRGKLVYLVNIYASCDPLARSRSWKKLVDFKNRNAQGSWCLRGEFNSISTIKERIGKSNKSYRKEMQCFNGFIKGMDLVDVPTIGVKFTWQNSKSKAMNMIDRFLLSDSLIVDWKVEGQIIGGRDISDHAPIWIKDSK